MNDVPPRGPVHRDPEVCRPVTNLSGQSAGARDLTSSPTRAAVAGSGKPTGIRAAIGPKPRTRSASLTRPMLDPRAAIAVTSACRAAAVTFAPGALPVPLAQRGGQAGEHLGERR